LSAQGNSANSNGKSGANDADSRWASLQAAVKISPGNSANAAKGSDEQKTQIATLADKSRATAASARDFYTKYPTHAKANEARKIEALAELRGVKSTDETQQKQALTIGKAFRSDHRQSLDARTEVALAMDRLELSEKIRRKAVSDRPVEKEKVADGVRAELGHTAALHAYYVEVSRNADMFTGKRIAQNLLQWPTDAKTKKEAQTIVDRSSLLGTRLNLMLPSAETGPVDLAKQSGGVTVLVVWAPAGGEKALKSLEVFRNSIPPGVQFVYLALGGTAKEIATLQSAAPIKGRFCHQTGPAVSPTLSALKLTGMPYIYVLNREGKVAGFGPFGELTSLLALAMR
jgi:hypothetical protein